MLNSMEPRYYTTASELFQIFHAAKRRLTVICMSYAHKEDTNLALQRTVESIQQSESRYRALTMKRRLNTSCRGLIEVHSTPTAADGPSHCSKDTGAPASVDSLDLRISSCRGSRLADSKVEYLHRTVKDWLCGPPARHMGPDYQRNTWFIQCSGLLGRSTSTTTEVITSKHS
jgi:hypothetical protein